VRTTLTLDDDVAAALARRRAERGTGLRQEVNELLRAGLAAARRPPAASDDGYELPTFDPGRALITDHRALKALLDDEDVERALSPRS
jgi:plasmid stability protein